MEDKKLLMPQTYETMRVHLQNESGHNIQEPDERIMETEEEHYSLSYNGPCIFESHDLDHEISEEAKKQGDPAQVYHVHG